MFQIKPHTEYAEIPDAGHAPSLMAPEQIAIVEEFLERGAAERLQRAA